MTVALTIALCLAALHTLTALWVPLVLALWFADVLQIPIRRLQKILGGPHRGAAAIVVLLALLIIVPLIGVTFAVIAGVSSLVEQLREGQGSMLMTFLGGSPTGTPSLRDWSTLLTRYGANAWAAFTTVAQASTAFLIGLFIFGIGLYTFAVAGPRLYAWFVYSAPMPRIVALRLARAFLETGRGLLLGMGVTALAQGAVATIAYVALGIPRAFLLGPLTMVTALFPLGGTALVWGPLAVGLGVTHDYARATAIVVLGIGVLGLMDNILRPILTRYGKLHLPTYVVLVSMLGGLFTFGASGVLLGPLLVRLALETIDIAREERLFR
jgi:predicted PurR-regulated permease PerM